MAGSRTLKLNILAETKDLVDGLRKADDATTSAGSKISGAFKAVGAAALAAGAAAGAFAVKLAVDGVKAAIEDEAAQVRLATALKNTTGATTAQIAAIEQQILKTSLATGVADDELRPALGRLAIATGDTAKAQDLLNLALDISASTGKPLEAVTQALGKAYEGNTTSLSRLGVGLGAADIKALGLEGTVKQLSDTFGGAATVQANTFQGQVDRLNVAFDEAKETIGAALLPILTQMLDFIVQKVFPVVQKFTDSFDKNATPAIEKIKDVIIKFVLPALQNLWAFIKDYVYPTLKNLLTPVINILRDAFEFLAGKIRENKAAFDTAQAIMLNIFAFVRDNLAPILGNVLATAFNIITRAIGLAIDNFGKVFAIIEKVARFLGFDLDLALNNATKKINANTQATADAYRQFNDLNKQTKDETLPSLAGLAGGFGNLAGTSNAAAGGIKAVTAAQREANALAKEIAALQAGGALPANLSPDLKRFYKSELGLISQYGGFIEGINLLPTDPFYGFGKGGNVNQAISQRQGGSATATGGTVINITGTVLDPEGTARAIQSVIQNSGARAGNLPLTPAGLVFE